MKREMLPVDQFVVAVFPPAFRGGLIEARAAASRRSSSWYSPPLFAGASLKLLATAHLNAADMIPPRFSRGPH